MQVDSWVFQQARSLSIPPPQSHVPPPPPPQALNVLMLKLLENCDRNSSFSALLALLLEAPPGVAGEPELEARCAWAQSRFIPFVFLCIFFTKTWGSMMAEEDMCSC